ncbi:amino acid/amide ABC transporter ATP-binding protein 1 (HAAT family) [Paucimonas lemoignei]|uniref:Amino acid/amide ABC transporter ATP-binding protein 1 (HAAT family) n=1 Tax=Paucimonas lemoignei TaxID=29443 RepID=A0A4R3I153_PAULE|nr:ABC transporter ATP-binding protein [Paucimonas lemoignei]TCS39252.1 amino acid/amide ABC transporter ATP-binding protein 1 (HAAT family) [Paucimonas lemoignei]
MKPVALELQNVCKRFGKLEIIRGVDLRVEQGERVVLIGPNGAGKSSLFNLISGRERADAGAIVLHGSPITGCKPYEINRRGLSRSFQVSSIFPKLSVFENVRCALLWSLGYRYSFWQRLNGLPKLRARADAVLEAIGLQACRDTLAGRLSYAEQRALEIGITIAGDADVILLDEPTSGMSRSESDAAAELIRRVTAGKTLLMVEHDMEVAFRLADRIAVLVGGQIIACDIPERVRANEAVQRAYLGNRAFAEVT